MVSQVAYISRPCAQVSSGPRSQPQDLVGHWKVFDVSAIPLPDAGATGVRREMLLAMAGFGMK